MPTLNYLGHPEETKDVGTRNLLHNGAGVGLVLSSGLQIGRGWARSNDSKTQLCTLPDYRNLVKWEMAIALSILRI